MSGEASLRPEDRSSSPTSVRHVVLAVATLMSVLLYLDRLSVGIASEYIREDLRMTQTQMAWFISAFFWSYALCQVPSGWLSDRFGARLMLTIYIIAWSALTGLMGIAHAVWVMLWFRLLCGIAQSGAYPTAVGVVRQWYPVTQRGRASSIVGLGGRFGGVLAPVLTAWMIVFFVTAEAYNFKFDDVLDDTSLMAQFDPDRSFNTNREIEVLRHAFVGQFLETLEPSERASLTSTAHVASQKMKERAEAKKNKSQPMANLRNWIEDWIPRSRPNAISSELRQSSGIDRLVNGLSSGMKSPDFIDFAAIPVKLPKPGQKLLDRKKSGAQLTDEENHRLNRFAMETFFPAEIRKSQGPGWRPTMIVYGIIGIVVAFAFSVIVRNSPQFHPWCNTAEKNYINDHVTQLTTSQEPQNASFPWKAFLTDISLWGNSLSQFLTNAGWLFVVTTLPRYLEKVHEVSLVTIGFMTAFPIGMGIVGMFAGGRWTDWGVRRFGLKWGRRVPLVLSRLISATGYGTCLLMGLLIEPSPDKTWLPWLYIAALCLAAGSSDLGTPAIWAYAQDVGGRYTGSILGWGNMWGNLGAAVAPIIYNYYLGEAPGTANWNMVFAFCTLSLVTAGLFALVIDSTKPLTVGRPLATS